MKTGNHFSTFMIGALLVILSGTVWAQPSYEWFEKKCTEFVKDMNDAEKECVQECDLEEKKSLINKMIKIQNKIDNLAPGDCPVENYNALCGGILNVENTPLIVLPSSLNLNIDESETLTATLDRTCKDGRNITGEIKWESMNSEIADITQEGLVTGKAKGITSVVAYSVDLPRIMSNPVMVEVGDLTKVDIAFVIDTNAFEYGYCNFAGSGFCGDEPKLPDFAAEYYAKIVETFGEFPYYRAYLFSYSNHKSLCTYNDPGFWCMDPGLSACYDSKVHSHLIGGMLSVSDFVNSFNSLQAVCNDTVHTNRYHGASIYSGLMKAIGSGTFGSIYWREDATKVIILVGAAAAGIWQDPVSQNNQCNDVEPVSNISRDMVIAKALEKGIKIMTINSGAYDCGSNYTPFGLFKLACLDDEFTALAADTGGIYYPSGVYSWGNGYTCHPYDYERIITAIEDIKNLAE